MPPKKKPAEVAVTLTVTQWQQILESRDGIPSAGAREAWDALTAAVYPESE